MHTLIGANTPYATRTHFVLTIVSLTVVKAMAKASVAEIESWESELYHAREAVCKDMKWNGPDGSTLWTLQEPVQAASPHVDGARGFVRQGTRTNGL